jgi:hypothetical protein
LGCEAVHRGVATALPLIAVAFSVEEPTLQAGVIFYCVSRKPLETGSLAAAYVDKILRDAKHSANVALRAIT